MLAAQKSSVPLRHNTHAVLPKLDWIAKTAMIQDVCARHAAYQLCATPNALSQQAGCMHADVVDSCSSVLQVRASMWNMTDKFIAAEVLPGEGAKTSKGSANSSTSQRVHKCCSSALKGVYMST